MGRVKGMKGYHDVKEYPEAITVPSLIVYHFNADLMPLFTIHDFVVGFGEITPKPNVVNVTKLK